MYITYLNKFILITPIITTKHNAPNCQYLTPWTRFSDK